MHVTTQHTLISLILFHFLLFPSLHSLSVPSPSPSPSPSPAPFEVLVPGKHFFSEFVDCTDPDNPHGFSIDVFERALQNLFHKLDWPTLYNIRYTCHDYSNATDDSNYSSMVKKLKEQKFDAVVGDITIAADRLTYANFTQSYVDSGIVQLTLAVGMSEPFPAVFLRPFTVGTWVLIGVSITSVAVAIFLLECYNDPNLRGLSKPDYCRRVVWFVIATLSFSSRLSVQNPLTKLVMVAWTFLAILGGVSYIASLSSILTVYKLDGKVKDLDVIKEQNLSVGFQVGSVVKEYLKERHKITNLVPLNGSDEYSRALSLGPYSPGGVATVVDEIPYISLFLANQPESNCIYSVSSTKLTTEGFGFAFRNGSLAKAFSVAMLNLSEKGDIHKLQDAYKLNNYECPSRVQSTKLDFKGSQGVFIFLACMLLLCLMVYIAQRSFDRFQQLHRERSEARSRSVLQEPHFHRSMKRMRSERHTLTYNEIA